MSTLTTSERIRLTLDLAMPYGSAVADQMTEHPRFAEIYPAYLRMLHGCIRAAVPLLQTARDVARSRAGDDPLAAQVADYYAEHVDEEQGHDLWVLEDLAVLGVAADSVVGQAPLARVASMVGAQYYWIHHVHPVVFLGYITVLEGYPPSPQRVERMEQRSRLPAAAFNTLKQHAATDLEHRRELFELMDRLPINQARQEAMIANALQTVDFQIEILRAVVDSVESASPAGAISPGNRVAGVA